MRHFLWAILLACRWCTCKSWVLHYQTFPFLSPAAHSLSKPVLSLVLCPFASLGVFLSSSSVIAGTSPQTCPRTF